MILKHAVCILFILFAGFAAHAGFGESVSVEGAVGLPSVTITNPDNSKAGYEGVSLLGRVHFPTYTRGSLLISTHGAYKRMNLENTYTGYGASEVADHSGFGVGMTMLTGKLVLGAEYMLMNANHHFTSDIGVNSSYDYNSLNLYLALSFRIGGLRGGVGYSYATATLDSGDTGLSQNVDYNEQQIYITFTFNTDANVGSFTKGIMR